MIHEIPTGWIKKRRWHCNDYHYFLREVEEQRKKRKEDQDDGPEEEEVSMTQCA